MWKIANQEGAVIPINTKKNKSQYSNKTMFFEVAIKDFLK